MVFGIIAIFSLAGFVVIAIGTAELIRTLRWRRKALRARGVVWEFVLERNSEREHLHPRIAFRAADKRRYEFVSRWGLWTGGRWNEGDRVEVLYDPDDPTKAEIQGFWELYGSPLLSLALGACSLTLALVVLVAVQ